MPRSVPSSSQLSEKTVVHASVALVEKERDLYRGLIDLNSRSEPDSEELFLKSALELVVRIAGAAHGYIEMFDPEGGEPSWAHSVGIAPDEVLAVRNLVSRGIIAEAVASTRTVVTPSALLDPRFRDRASVKSAGIDAVLCAPIGVDSPQGVLYLGSGSGSSGVFSTEDVELVGAFCRHVAPILRQLLLRKRHAQPDAAADLRQKLRADGYVGRSAALMRVFHEVRAVASLDIGVLLTGETGTGKTQLARLIHHNSSRSSGPFVEVSCGALQDSLFENELFGSVQGGHSAAARAVQGKAGAARDGTLFLDEVENLSLAAQSKLLQFLQSKEYFPVGSTHPVRVDVRIIAATNKDLESLVAERLFREDLYYRLHVLTIRLPSLSERTEDIALLARHFCERAREKHKLCAVELSPAALNALETSVWPGNVRQLANKVEAATIRAAAAGLLHVDVSGLFPDRTSSGRTTPIGFTFQEETRRFQAQLVLRVLQSEDWNISAAARRLDITRSHLYTLIKSFGLQR
jgi:Nif-specific regulatory protein